MRCIRLGLVFFAIFGRISTQQGYDYPKPEIPFPGGSLPSGRPGTPLSGANLPSSSSNSELHFGRPSNDEKPSGSNYYPNNSKAGESSTSFPGRPGIQMSQGPVVSNVGIHEPGGTGPIGGNNAQASLKPPSASDVYPGQGSSIRPSLDKTQEPSKLFPESIGSSDAGERGYSYPTPQKPFSGSIPVSEKQGFLTSRPTSNTGKIQSPSGTYPQQQRPVQASGDHSRKSGQNVSEYSGVERPTGQFPSTNKQRPNGYTRPDPETEERQGSNEYPAKGQPTTSKFPSNGIHKSINQTGTTGHQSGFLRPVGPQFVDGVAEGQTDIGRSRYPNANAPSNNQFFSGEPQAHFEQTSTFPGQAGFSKEEISVGTQSSSGKPQESFGQTGSYQTTGLQTGQQYPPLGSSVQLDEQHIPSRPLEGQGFLGQPSLSRYPGSDRPNKLEYPTFGTSTRREGGSSDQQAASQSPESKIPTETQFPTGRPQQTSPQQPSTEYLPPNQQNGRSPSPGSPQFQSSGRFGQKNDIERLEKTRVQHFDTSGATQQQARPPFSSAEIKESTSNFFRPDAYPNDKTYTNPQVPTSSAPGTINGHRNLAMPESPGHHTRPSFFSGQRDDPTRQFPKPGEYPTPEGSISPKLPSSSGNLPTPGRIDTSRQGGQSEISVIRNRIQGSESHSKFPEQHNSFPDESSDDGQYEGDDFSAIPGEPNIDYPILSFVQETSFRCNDQQYPGYYADVEARCQVFHICAHNRTYDFLCPNGTIFHQEYLVCVWWNQFDCNTAPSLFGVNENIYNFSVTGVQQTGGIPAPGQVFPQTSGGLLEDTDLGQTSGSTRNPNYPTKGQQTPGVISQGLNGRVLETGGQRPADIGAVSQTPEKYSSRVPQTAEIESHGPQGYPGGRPRIGFANGAPTGLQPNEYPSRPKVDGTTFQRPGNRPIEEYPSGKPHDFPQDRPHISTQSYNGDSSVPPQSLVTGLQRPAGFSQRPFPGTGAQIPDDYSSRTGSESQYPNASQTPGTVSQIPDRYSSGIKSGSPEGYSTGRPQGAGFPPLSNIPQTSDFGSQISGNYPSGGISGFQGHFMYSNGRPQDTNIQSGSTKPEIHGTSAGEYLGGSTQGPSSDQAGSIGRPQGPPFSQVASRPQTSTEQRPGAKPEKSQLLGQYLNGKPQAAIFSPESGKPQMPTSLQSLDTSGQRPGGHPFENPQIPSVSAGTVDRTRPGTPFPGSPKPHQPTREYLPPVNRK